MLRLESISKSFGVKQALRDFSLEVGEGEIFILLGASGCGKTTLLRLIAGFDRPDSGRIFVGDLEIGSLPAEQRPVGFIFQKHALFPHMTVYDNIAVGPRIRGVSETEISRQVGELLKIARIESIRYSMPGRISGGESQRVALARAIVNRPRILLLDEPLSALDPSLRQNLRRELTEMQKSFGATFLFVTHDQEEAMSLGGRMGVLENGALLQTGSSRELYDRPANPFVAQFLGENNRLHGKVVESSGNRATVELSSGVRVQGVSGRSIETGGQTICFMRPENLQLVKPDSDWDRFNRLTGTVESLEFFGSHTSYGIRVEGCERIQTLAMHGGKTDPGGGNLVGERVDVVFRPEDVLVFEAEAENAN